jgi:iron complex outermembrane receptor protein
MNFKNARRGLLLGCSAIVSASSFALVGASSAAAATAAQPVDQIQEVVVTAQRREQNVQDVPVAVTALTQETISVNRIVSVNDLSMLAPGFSVVPSAGGTQIPSFTVRGRTSYGVVPGSDKPISVYLDGVYISSARGSIFDLPDIAQIEMLRGPQGTLFGRNATAGAVSITTRDPKGVFGVTQSFTVGNYDQFRTRTTIDTPTWGPFSAYVSYVRDYQRGDVKNLGAGTVWNYSAVNTGSVPKTLVSPKYLGTTNTNSVFVAVKFQPTDRFTAVYKYDWSNDHGSPEAVAYVGGAPATVGAVESLLGATFPAPTSIKRPDAVNNAFDIPRIQVNSGHSIVATYQGDSFTIKNIAALRDTLLWTSDQLDGLGGLTTSASGALFGVPAAFGGYSVVGAPVILFGITNETRSRQWSDELQYIYRSKHLTLTVGGLLFETKDQNGAIPGTPNNTSSLPFFFSGYGPDPFAGNTIPAAESVFYDKGDSIAAYAQAEYHVTSQFDIIGGIRETKDWKSGSQLLTAPPGYFGALPPTTFKYTANRPSYLIDFNYKPTDEVMVYAKYSTGFVSGGKVGAIPFLPETVQAWEFGFKGEFFERHVRTNVALYNAFYKDLQASEGGGTFKGAGLLAQYPWIPALGTFIIDQGSDHSKGVEFEGTWLVMHGVTLGSDVSYTDTKFVNVNSLVDNPAGVPPNPTLLPKWTVNVWGHYERNFGDGLKGSVRVDADWRSSEYMNNPLLLKTDPEYASLISVPARWLVNGRATISGFKLGPVSTEVSLWAKNITDDRSSVYTLMIPSFIATANYQQARTFGLDINLKY